MSDNDRLADPEEAPLEQELERSLRPRSLSAFIGQPVLREQLEIFIEAAKSQGMSRSTMSFWPVRPAWARPRSRTSSRWRWG